MTNSKFGLLRSAVFEEPGDGILNKLQFQTKLDDLLTKKYDFLAIWRVILNLFWRLVNEHAQTL